MAPSCFELDLTSAGDARDRAVAEIGEAFSSLRPGLRHDLLDVTTALLSADSHLATGRATRLSIHVDRGRVRGDVHYRRPRLGMRRRPRLAGLTRALRDRAFPVRHCGLNESGTGVWFDLGRC